MRNNGKNAKAGMSAITVIIAVLGLGLSIFNTYEAHHNPAALSIKVLGFSGPMNQSTKSVAAANLVFTNLGKRDLIIAGVFLRTPNPCDSNNVFVNNWISYNGKEKGVPCVVPADQAILKSIVFDGPNADELAGMASRCDAKEIRTSLIVTVVDKKGALVDIHFDIVRFIVDRRGKCTAFVFDSNRNTATLRDAAKQQSILEQYQGHSVAY